MLYFLKIQNLYFTTKLSAIFACQISYLVNLHWGDAVRLQSKARAASKSDTTDVYDKSNSFICDE